MNGLQVLLGLGGTGLACLAAYQLGLGAARIPWLACLATGAVLASWSQLARFRSGPAVERPAMPERQTRQAGGVHPVTALPVREDLFDAIQSDIDRKIGPGLLGVIRLCDFDRMASFDRRAADHALAAFAARLRLSVRSIHQLAQIDRDCFSVWYRGADDLAAARAEFRALAYLSRQELTGQETILTPTIEAGVATFPEDGSDPSQLLVRAMAALRPPEISQDGQLALVEPPSLERARAQFNLEQDLAQAIIQEELAMCFQPVVDLSNDRLIGAEALLRWDHPRLGPVSPAHFIPVVEKIGLSDRFGLWVLNAACREARAWQDAGLSDLKIAVNLSARQLLDPGLRQKIERTLRRHGLEPAALELELTETAAMADAARTLELFGELRAMGISLAIDDFGSGYSSLSYLKTLPFDKLKIDREFVTALDQRTDSHAICKALIELGRGLGLKVLAEGVETRAEVEALSALGCRIFQGFYFSRPLPGPAFRQFAVQQPWRAPPVPSKRRVSA